MLRSLKPPRWNRGDLPHAQMSSAPVTPPPHCMRFNVLVRRAQRKKIRCLSPKLNRPMSLRATSCRGWSRPRCSTRWTGSGLTSTSTTSVPPRRDARTRGVSPPSFFFPRGSRRPPTVSRAPRAPPSSAGTARPTASVSSDVTHPRAHRSFLSPRIPSAPSPSLLTPSLPSLSFSPSRQGQPPQNGTESDGEGEGEGEGCRAER